MRHVLLQEVDHSGHLRVNEDAVAVSLQLGQEAVEEIIAASIYEAKTVSTKTQDGKKLEIQFVRVAEAHDEQARETGWKENGVAALMSQ